MNAIQKIGMKCTLATLPFLAVGCADEVRPMTEKAIEEVFKLKSIDDMSVREYYSLINGAEEARKRSIFNVNSEVNELQFWDSVRTDALCKKAYLEGAQMVRDSIAKAKGSELNNK